MVWQLVVLPGTHNVTVVNSVLTSGVVLVGPASTTMPATLAPVGVEPPGAVELTPAPPLPPPQDSTTRHRAAYTPKRHARAGRPRIATRAINANLPHSRRWARPAAGRQPPKRSAYARRPAPPDRFAGFAGDGVPSAAPSLPPRSYRSIVPGSRADSARWGRSTRLQTPCRRTRRTRVPRFRRSTGVHAADNSHAG